MHWATAGLALGPAPGAALGPLPATSSVQPWAMSRAAAGEALDHTEMHQAVRWEWNQGCRWASTGPVLGPAPGAAPGQHWRSTGEALGAHHWATQGQHWEKHLVLHWAKQSSTRTALGDALGPPLAGLGPALGEHWVHYSATSSVQPWARSRTAARKRQKH
jgi:hypothetical protein